MQAVILAAGMGTRLGALTAANTKCMISVNGTTLISRMLSQLDSLNLRRIIIVVGYAGNALIDYIATLDINTPIEYVDNSIYDKTNNIHSLWLVRDKLVEDDTILLESDLIFEDAVLDLLVTDTRPSLALVDKYASWMDGTVVKLREDDTICDFIDKQHFSFDDIASYYKTVNMYKFARDFSDSVYVPFLDAYVRAWGANSYYEQVLRVLSMLDDQKIKAKRLTGQLWYEIDDIQDLDIAESIFHNSAAQRVTALSRRYGGYWRYPKLLDFCYLVNPFFPPQNLQAELQASFASLLTQYPSGMQVNCLLVGKNFNIDPQTVVVGNGASEILQVIMGNSEGKVGLIRPTFEEYSNRLPSGAEITFAPSSLSYTASAIKDFFKNKNIKMLVVINPDNPTGNYIQRSEMICLAEWATATGIRLIVDESFVDFADENNATLLTRDFFYNYPSVVVIKSISKSYGVPGLRLGIGASGDVEYIEQLRKDMSIWNINSFAEFFLQIQGKYQQEYLESLVHYRTVRERFAAQLRTISGLSLLPTQANFIMLNVSQCSLSAAELTERLLVRRNILIKDLSDKMKQIGMDGDFIRLAIRNDTDNDFLVNALRTELEMK